MFIMGRYTRTYHSYDDLRDPKAKVLVEVYTQPLKDRVRYLGFNAVFKLSLIRPIHWAIDGPLEALGQFAHSRGCAGDCTAARTYSRETDEWTDVRICGHTSLCAKIDLKIYDLDTRNNRILGRVEPPEEEQ